MQLETPLMISSIAQLERHQGSHPSVLCGAFMVFYGVLWMYWFRNRIQVHSGRTTAYTMSWVYRGHKWSTVWTWKHLPAWMCKIIVAVISVWMTSAKVITPVVDSRETIGINHAYRDWVNSSLGPETLSSPSYKPSDPISESQSDLSASVFSV